MPIYRFVCYSCNKEADYFVRKVGAAPQKCECGGQELKRVEAASRVAVRLKGWDWPSKTMKLSNLMKRKQRNLERRQYVEHGEAPRIAPNVEGEKVGSWKEAKELASEKGLGTAGYDEKIAEESNV